MLRYLWACLVCLFSIHALAALNFSVQTVDGVQWVKVDGTIDEHEDFYIDSQHNLNSQLRGQISVNYPTVFEFQSPGGYGNTADNVAELLTRIAHDIEFNGNEVWSYVATHCESACVPLFVSFRKRAMDSTAKIGLHAASVNGVMSEWGTYLYLFFLESKGVSKDWVQSKNNVFRSTMITYFYASQLVAENSGIVEAMDSILSRNQLIDQIKAKANQ
jgi:hypothetical protein